MKTLAACLWLIVSSSTCNLQDPAYFKLIQHTMEEHFHFCNGDHDDHHYNDHENNFSEVPSQPFIAPKTESIPPCCPHGGGTSCFFRDDEEDDNNE